MRIILEAISSIFHFLPLLSYPPKTKNAWAGQLNLEKFSEMAKNLSGEFFLNWHKTTHFLGDSLLVHSTFTTWELI